MAYSLVRLAPGSYDVLRDGVVIAGVVRSGQTSDATWTVEPLQDLPPQERPAPFMDIEHSFASLDEARTWLGGAEVLAQGPNAR